MTAESKAMLREIAELNPPLTEKPSDDAVVSFVPMAAVSAMTADTNGGEERTYREVAKSYTPFLAGDLLVAKITPCFENGKIAQANIRNKVGFGSSEFHVVRPRTGRADGRYLLHFLRQEWIRLDGERKMTGSAGQRRVPEYFLAQLTVPLPPLPEQRRIAAILDKADALRAKRRAALEQLNGLTQAMFLEMFGDPAMNRKAWPVVPISDLLVSACYGTSEKAGGVGAFPILRMGNITATGDIDVSDLKFIDLKDADKEKFTVRVGDILFNRTNSRDLVGKSAMVRTTTPMAFAGYLIRLRVNDKNNPEYLSAFLNSAYAKRVLRNMCKAIIGMANINATEIQRMTIPMPPLDLQNEFARVIARVERSKGTVQTCSHLDDDLFASLQHQAFSGAL